MSTLLEKEVVEETTLSPTDDGDHDRFAHFISKDLIDAYMLGEAVEALCGKVIQGMKDAQKYSVCPTCKEIKESLPE